MKFVIQRVTKAQVDVNGATIGKIGKGFLVLIGVSREDNRAIADKLVKKLIGLRIFEDAEGKTNLSLADVEGSLLLVSQFTLYADCKKGNRPSFIHAGAPGEAEALYEYIIERCRENVPIVETGSFGAEMKVSLVNDGPFTIILDVVQSRVLPADGKGTQVLPCELLHPMPVIDLDKCRNTFEYLVGVQTADHHKRRCLDDKGHHK